jgi:methylisocitrate lyase
MLYSKTTPEQKRIRLRELLASGTIAQFPGAFNPLSARLIEEKGFAGVYISGAVLANDLDLGLPAIGLTTLTEVATRAGQIARMTDLPAIVDADIGFGFGEPMNVARSVQAFAAPNSSGEMSDDHPDHQLFATFHGTSPPVHRALPRLERSEAACRRDRWGRGKRHSHRPNLPSLFDPCHDHSHYHPPRHLRQRTF